MQIDNLSWFPGHMTKTKRMISAEIKNMDAVCEIVDARIPMSSRNPDVDELTAGKPRLIVLNRADQADPAETRRWTQYFRTQGCAVLDKQYPEYQFARHKGYGTKLHYEMLDKFGPCAEHRMSFLKKWSAGGRT